MKPGEQSRQLFKGAVILTIAALFMKILSSIYRIPFQNIVGDIGFYIYQQVYPFYGIAVALSTYGFPVVISKLYAEEQARGNKRGLKQLFSVTAAFLTLFGLICFTLLYEGSSWLAEYMNDPQLAILIKVIAFVFLTMPIISLLRGFFQGAGDMIPTAISQIGEQLIRVATILIASIFLINQGYSLYEVGGGAVFGSITGGVMAAIILIFFWLQKKEINLSHGRYSIIKSGRIIKTLAIQGLTICISSMLLIFIQLADSLTLYNLLVDSGINEEAAKRLKGIYDRGQPLIQLGTVVATSMSLSLVPLISSQILKRDKSDIKGKIALAVKVSILVGAGAAIGLISIIKPTNVMLFENDKGHTVLTILCIVIFLASVIITITSIFQGLGHTIFPAILVIICFLLKYWLNIIFIPYFGTIGAAISSLLALLTILGIAMIRLRKILNGSLIEKRFYVVITIAGLFMMASLRLYVGFIELISYDIDLGRLMATFQALSAVLIGGLVYVILVIRGRLFTRDELLLIPFGHILIQFLPKNKRR
jgi:O-antigen/teichoic acid export membrane protein